jgi:hypothetical protein
MTLQWLLGIQNTGMKIVDRTWRILVTLYLLVLLGIGRTSWWCSFNRRFNCGHFRRLASLSEINAVLNTKYCIKCKQDPNRISSELHLCWVRSLGWFFSPSASTKTPYQNQIGRCKFTIEDTVPKSNRAMQIHVRLRESDQRAPTGKKLQEGHGTCPPARNRKCGIDLLSKYHIIAKLLLFENPTTPSPSRLGHWHYFSRVSRFGVTFNFVLVVWVEILGLF